MLCRRLGHRHDDFHLVGDPGGENGPCAARMLASAETGRIAAVSRLRPVRHDDAAVCSPATNLQLPVPTGRWNALLLFLSRSGESLVCFGGVLGAGARVLLCAVDESTETTSYETGLGSCKVSETGPLVTPKFFHLRGFAC